MSLLKYKHLLISVAAKFIGFSNLKYFGLGLGTKKIRTGARSESENVTPVTSAMCYRLCGNFRVAIISNTMTKESVL